MISSKHIQEGRHSRDSILSKISEVEIFEKYLQVPFQTARLFRNPLRNDKNPTCSFLVSNEGVLLKDFSGWFTGDCFGLIMKIYNCTIWEAYNKVAEDFKVGSLGFPNTVYKPKPSKKKELKIKRREFNEEDMAFWLSFGITEDVLNHFKVSAIEYAWIDDKVVYQNTKKSPGYAYHFIGYEYKVYYPFGKYKFVSNNARIQGFKQLVPADICVITKSMKDVMTLYSYGITAIAPPSEAAIIKKELITYLKLEYKKIVLFYDNDETGRAWSELNSKEYDLPMVFLPQGTKDISDYRKDYGDVATNKVLKLLKLKQ